MKINPEVEARFWAKVARASPDDCWEWSASRSLQGYGLLKVDKVNRRASHVALAIDGRPRPDGMLALHSCDNPPCCNPRHLRWGTPTENAADMVGRDRCWRGGSGFGEAHSRARLTTESARSIRTSPLGYKALARLHGVERTTIRSIKRSKTWAAA